MIRKVIVIAFALIALSAAPAAAQYGPGGAVGGEEINQGNGGVAGAGADAGSGTDDGTLARTGSNVLDLAPYGAALIAGGAAIILVTRRRSTSTLAA